MAPSAPKQQDDGTTDGAVAIALATLRRGGQRITPARRAVIEALATTSDHLSADAIVADLEAGPDGIHRATVYRTLDSLVHLGVISHVHLPHGATTYHLAQADTARHLHLVCRGCDAVVDAPADLLEEAMAKAAESLDFRLDPDHVALTGWCQDCS